MADIHEVKIAKASSLRELNAYLTDLMARQKIQLLLKNDSRLQAVLSTVKKLSERELNSGPLTAITVLGRLIAVARGKEEERKLLSAAVELMKKEPPSLNILSDAEEKTYAAQVLQWIEEDWVIAYATREAVAIDSAENARRVLLEIVLHNTGSISLALQTTAAAFEVIGNLLSAESKARRAKRISAAWADIVRSNRISPGSLPGSASRDFASAILPAAKQSLPDDITCGIAEDILAILTRIIELRFSLALDAETYSLLATCRMRLGRELWYRFIASSQYAEQILNSLNEAALVLARQGRTDRTIVDALLVMHPDRTALKRSLSRHFPQTLELDSGFKNWWLSGGMSASQSGASDSQVFNTSEDQRIGEALIEIEKIDTSVRYIASTVKPELQFSNPPAAASLSKIVATYTLLAQNLRMLAKMRKLSVTHIDGQVVEYNVSQHEMLGGHQDGIRLVKVVREGVEKVYQNRHAILVKPWVEPVNT